MTRSLFHYGLYMVNGVHLVSPPKHGPLEFVIPILDKKIVGGKGFPSKGLCQRRFTPGG